MRYDGGRGLARRTPVAHAPDMPDEAEDVVVFETFDPTELSLARNLFEQAGIPFRVEGGSASALLGTMLGAGFGGRQALRVPAALEERALELLDAAWPEGADGAGPVQR